jgi:hypothetical protein
MALIVEVSVNREGGVGTLVIQRLAELTEGLHASYPYRAGIIEPDDQLPRAGWVHVEHIYADGAWVLIRKALLAIETKQWTHL